MKAQMRYEIGVIIRPATPWVVEGPPSPSKKRPDLARQGSWAGPARCSMGWAWAQVSKAQPSPFKPMKTQPTNTSPVPYVLIFLLECCAAKPSLKAQYLFTFIFILSFPINIKGVASLQIITQPHHSLQIERSSSPFSSYCSNFLIPVGKSLIIPLSLQISIR